MSKRSSLPTYLVCALFTYSLICSSSVDGQEIPAGTVLEIDHLADFLKEDVQSQLAKENVILKTDLARYLREKFSERFFYDHRSFDNRFIRYNQIYNNEQDHRSLANDHLNKYADSTLWKLPFNYLYGEPVDAYALRHLARQHKMVDIAFLYFYSEKNPIYVRYFVNQMASLNAALKSGSYDKIEDGNGVYEVFRSGYRILNWLTIHNMFLGEETYSDEDQLQTIATLLQHGSHLYERNDRFRSGNHQTRGMSALAMLSILLWDFEGTEQWYERAMTRLGEHLDKEINQDGFQFERSVHYHMSDIDNYFYVYQLAKKSDFQVGEVWEEKLRSLFSTLTKIAYPDKSAPVLQDDTEIPWGEKNDISGTMTLGYLLFEEPEFGYFAGDRVKDKMYWFLEERQLNLLSSIQRKSPTHSSLMFPETGYYIMREGWGKNDKMMIISAGLDEKKPDHQHGDMLGVQAMSNGNIILPNYQVRYSLSDFDFFKNSLVKNVALVDDELQGKEWTSNKGGSGFGKFKLLPNPETITWTSNDKYDLYVGSHDGFENIGVEYSRQVIYVKNDFWIVKDNFSSENAHTFKQVWQGHYTAEEGPALIRSTFDDASGCDILQLGKVDLVSNAGQRGKHWSVISSTGKEDFNFVTVIFPYKGYANRIDESSQTIMLKDWIVNRTDWILDGNDPISITRRDENFFFGIHQLSRDQWNIFLEESSDLYVQVKDHTISIQLIGDRSVTLTTSGIRKGQVNDKNVGNKVVMNPGDRLVGEVVKW